MKENVQLKVFMRILENQITMMSALEEIRYKTTKILVSRFQNLSEEKQKTKDFLRTLKET